MARQDRSIASAARDDENRADTAMASYAAGDPRAFRIVYERLAPRLRLHLRRIIQDASRVDDLVQQTFLRIHLARSTFTPGCAVRPWAWTIAERLAIDLRRRLRHEQPLDEEGLRMLTASTPTAGTAEDELSVSECAKTVDAVLAGVSRGQRAAYNLVRLQGMAIADAAASLRTTTNGIKLRLHRVSKSLRAALDLPREERKVA
jgi:RNA polymerase sigma-70 factor (ECF subfamily)